MFDAWGCEQQYSFCSPRGELFFNQISDGMLAEPQKLPPTALPGLVGIQSVGRAILAGIIFANESARADSRRCDRLTMSGVLRLYKTLRGKAAAHRLWRCF